MFTWLAELTTPSAGNITASAILGWYAWHTAAKTIPSLMSDFRQEMAASRDICREDREVFRQELAEQRAQQHADNLSILETLRELTRDELRRGAA